MLTLSAAFPATWPKTVPAKKFGVAVGHSLALRQAQCLELVETVEHSLAKFLAICPPSRARNGAIKTEFTI